MTSFLDSSSLYNLPNTAATPVLHQKPIEAELIFLVNSEVEIQPEILEMLDKISAALKLNQSQVEYLVFKEPLVLVDLVELYKVKHVVVFGAEAKELNINAQLPVYKTSEFSQFKLLIANDVLDVYGNAQLKAKLWKALQEMFK